MSETVTETPPEANVVWQNTVDAGAWKIQVIRTGEYTAILEIEDTAKSEIVHREPVGLSYQAIFGPDVADVATWEDRVIDVIDHPEKRQVSV